jgi:hypothetical protein
MLYLFNFIYGHIPLICPASFFFLHWLVLRFFYLLSFFIWDCFCYSFFIWYPGRDWSIKCYYCYLCSDIDLACIYCLDASFCRMLPTRIAFNFLEIQGFAKSFYLWPDQQHIVVLGNSMNLVLALSVFSVKIQRFTHSVNSVHPQIFVLAFSEFSVLQNYVFSSKCSEFTKSANIDTLFGVVVSSAQIWGSMQDLGIVNIVFIWCV